MDQNLLTSHGSGHTWHPVLPESLFRKYISVLKRQLSCLCESWLRNFSNPTCTCLSIIIISQHVDIWNLNTSWKIPLITSIVIGYFWTTKEHLSATVSLHLFCSFVFDTNECNLLTANQHPWLFIFVITYRIIFTCLFITYTSTTFFMSRSISPAGRADWTESVWLHPPKGHGKSEGAAVSLWIIPPWTANRC